MKRSLPPCPESPNCVSTQSTDPRKRMAPLRYQGSAGDARKAILELLQETKRVRVLDVEPEYLRAEFTTPILRFVDDVEFLLDPEAGLVHFRSASRVGRSDLGVNRRRMSNLCRKLVSRDRRFDFAPSVT